MVRVVAGATPYRSRLAILVPRGDDLRWRRRASHGAMVVLWGVGLGAVASDAVDWLLAPLVLWGTWLLTTPKSSDARTERALATALLALASSDALLMVGGSLEQGVVSLVRGVVQPSLPVVGMLYVSTRFTAARLPESARSARWSAGLLTAGFGLTALGPEVLGGASRSSLLPYLLVATAVLGVLCLVGYVQAFFWTLSLCAALRVVAHEWWLEEAALPHIRWASYSRMASGAVELLLVDGRSERFDNGTQALDWAFGNGFVPADMAIALELVQRAPEPP